MTVGLFEDVTGLRSKRPGKAQYSDIIIRRMAPDDASLDEWMQEASKGKAQRKDMSIVLQDKIGNDVRRWNLYGSLPTRLIWSNSPRGGQGDESSLITQIGFEVEAIEWVNLFPPEVQLECPVVSENPVELPPLPYEEDCDLVGRTEEIEAYLQELEAIAADCLARREAAWQAVLDARSDLDAQIDDLPEPPPPDLEHSIRVPLSCFVFPGASESAGPSVPPFEGEYYTSWLRGIGENVARYCQMIDELIKPLADACENMNEEIACIIEDRGGVSEGERTAFHARLNGKMNAATLLYEYTDFFYTQTLGQYGFGNFRDYFNENSIDCSSDRNKLIIPQRRDVLVVPSRGPAWSR